MAFTLQKFVRALVGFTVIAGITQAPSATAGARDEAVIVYLKLAGSEFGAEGESFALYDVEDAVERAIAAVGELDGHEIGGGYFTIFTYGQDADALFRAMRSALENPVVQRGSYVLVRRGGPQAPVERVELGR